jgi:hypothetical protein
MGKDATFQAILLQSCTQQRRVRSCLLDSQTQLSTAMLLNRCFSKKFAPQWRKVL